CIVPTQVTRSPAIASLTGVGTGAVFPFWCRVVGPPKPVAGMQRWPPRAAGHSPTCRRPTGPPRPACCSAPGVGGWTCARRAREAVNSFYDRFPDVLDGVMARFGQRTGRHYRPFDYIGHPRAGRVLVLMGSGAECAHETLDWLLARGEKVGLLKVRLFRPFSA